MKNKKFEKLLLKNTLAIVLPAIVVFCVLIFMFLRYPLLEKIKCNTIVGVENLDAHFDLLYENETTNVEYIAEEIYYTGFNYMEDNKLKGAYYYSFEDENLMLFLVKTDNPKMSLSSETIKGRIIKDSVTTEHIMSLYAEENGIQADALKDYCSKYVLSEIDYPYAYNTLIYVLFALPIVICVLIIFIAVLVFVNPTLHTQSKQLSVYGDIAEIINELNIQLKNNLLLKKNNIYITMDYMIVNYMNKTDVIKLDFVKYTSKNIVEKHIWPYNKIKVYRLTLSNPDKIFYEVDFTNEDTIDSMKDYIDGILKNL